MNYGLAGRYKLIVSNEDGIVRETDWFDNLITDAGLERIATAGVGGYCMVGTGSSAPAEANTTLAAQVGSTQTLQAQDITITATAAPWYRAYRVTYRFATGVAAGNLTEVGVGWTSTLVFSRTLIKDGNGNPTTLTVLPTETLDVVYEFRVYVPATDVAYSLTISGVAYTGLVRASGATSGLVRPDAVFGGGVSSTSGYSMTVYSGPAVLGAVTGSPTGATASTDVTAGFTAAAYTAGSRKRVLTFSMPLTQGNLAGGITALRIQNLYAGQFQMSMSPAFDKTAAKTASLVFELSWARAVG